MKELTLSRPEGNLLLPVEFRVRNGPARRRLTHVTFEDAGLGFAYQRKFNPFDASDQERWYHVTLRSTGSIKGNVIVSNCNKSPGEETQLLVSPELDRKEMIEYLAGLDAALRSEDEKLRRVLNSLQGKYLNRGLAAGFVANVLRGSSPSGDLLEEVRIPESGLVPILTEGSGITINYE